MRMPLPFTACALAALAAASCDKAPEETVAAPPAAAPYNTEIDVNELMVHAMDPAARAFWAGWGEMYDDKGLHDLSPKNEEEWKKVEDGAAMVVLATNSLMLPYSQRKPESEWLQRAKKVADIAMEGKNAAELQDVKAMEEIGGRLDV